jgi:hypothetical protein
VREVVKIILVCFVLFVQALPVCAQNAQNQPMDEEVWQELTEDMDFEEEEARERKELNGPNIKFDWSIFKYLFFSIVLGILVYFLVRYLLTLQGNAAIKEEIQVEVNTLQEAEENPMQANLTALIDKLVAEKNYREATRAYFLLVLQRMYKTKLIEWKKPKTNFDYVRELGDKPFHENFNQLTRYFELIWYGKQAVHQTDFQQIEPKFKQLINTVNQHAR